MRDCNVAWIGIGSVENSARIWPYTNIAVMKRHKHSATGVFIAHKYPGKETVLGSELSPPRLLLPEET